eukprot:7464943-Pyramimonas_sp.AAC.1
MQAKRRETQGGRAGTVWAGMIGDDDMKIKRLKDRLFINVLSSPVAKPHLHDSGQKRGDRRVCTILFGHGCHGALRGGD